MTDFTNFTIQNGYGDILSGTNNGQGLTNALQNVTDGLGNASAIQLSRTTINIAGIFQVGGDSIYNPANPNVVTVPNKADPDPVAAPNGSIYYNTTNNVFRVRMAGAWRTMTTT
jgi:hypothetical protein